ncbi:MAG: iron ABC transporter [Desulfatitalea sp.]|nr:metal ABC transporter permease [Desulfatitalea sp.]NNJ99407.1 iron ABC transporter [Desulfatitalea sp.]
MQWTFLDTWIIVTGMLSAMSCALLGSYLVLRRMSMMGDAISHAVLPGLAVAFLITGSRDSLPMLAGAVAVGVLTAVLIQGVNRLSGLDQGASMGVIFTTLFALGLILIRQAADHVDLDPGCVLYGAIELTPLDTYALFGWEVPRAALTNGLMLLVNSAFVLLFFKELRITSFDPGLATTMGFNASVMHYVLMGLVAATTIAAFESVGSIIVIAMLIVPGAAAHLLSDRLGPMLVISLVLAALAAVLGHLGAITVPTWIGFRDTSTAGMMAVAVGLLFLAAFLFGPRHGVVGRMIAQGRLALRINRDDVLGMLYRVRELTGQPSAAVKVEDLRKALKAGWWLNVALVDLTRKKLIHCPLQDMRLTEKGMQSAANLIRSHRLWETYLCDKLGFCDAEAHYAAHRLEHVTDQKMQQRLRHASNFPNEDPHHKPIP